MATIYYKDQQVTWDIVNSIELKDIDGKPCLVFLNQGSKTPEILHFDSQLDRDDAHQQIRQQLKDAGVLHEFRFKLR